jgi:hypothetical protein
VLVIRIYVVGVDVERTRMLEVHQGGGEGSGRRRCKGGVESDEDGGSSCLLFLDTTSLAWYMIKNESTQQCYVRMACESVIQVDRRLARRASCVCLDPRLAGRRMRIQNF